MYIVDHITVHCHRSLNLKPLLLAYERERSKDSSMNHSAAIGHIRATTKSEWSVLEFPSQRQARRSRLVGIHAGPRGRGVVAGNELRERRLLVEYVSHEEVGLPHIVR
jgi:hypothetical protein